MSKKLHASKHLRNVAERFCNIQTVAELAKLLKVTEEQLIAISDNPAYKIFKIPK
jgi:hypothetical protein